jgi:hypothetical protein
VQSFSHTVHFKITNSLVKKTVGADQDTIIDLSNENGDVVDLCSKSSLHANKFLEARSNYILVRYNTLSSLCRFVEEDGDIAPYYTSYGEVGEKIRFQGTSVKSSPTSP